MKIPEKKLKEIMLEYKILDENKVKEVVDYAVLSGISFYDSLLEKNIITDEKLGQLVAKKYKLGFVTLSQITIDQSTFKIIPEKTARKYKIVAFSVKNNAIEVAIADPESKELLEMLSKKTGKKIIPYFATERDIDRIFQIYKKDLQEAFNDLIHKESIGKTSLVALDEAPIANIVDLLLYYAAQANASDVHVEPQETTSLVRFRLDGILHDVVKFPKNLHEQIITRIKVICHLRTDEHNNPQDGKMRFVYEDSYVDIRVSIIHTVDGEKAVLRLLPARSRLFSLLDLGIGSEDLKKITRAIDKPYGMILGSGPTGSGKTTSIYAIIKMLNSREKNITTIEDPVEYKIKGINQIQVKTDTEFTFAKGLRSVLRQDPNIIFVGEIRDIETAGIAVNAALTGHLVLSTLHTNNSATALLRLIDMEVEPFLVSSTVNIIIGQRLVRKVCDICKKPIIINPDKLSIRISPSLLKKFFNQETKLKTFKGEGCKICSFTGYSGRIGLFEVLEVSKDIRQLVMDKADSEIIEKKAIAEGMNTMLVDGLEKVKNGLTTMEEIVRVTKV